jgi:peroxiredoxin
MAIETPPARLGTACPEFRLPAVDGKCYRLGDFERAPVLVVMFICNHCPYARAVEDRLIRLARDLGPRGAAFVGVCSNDAVTYPDDAFDKLAERWRHKQYGFPYLHDEAQDVARAFGAVCTPDIFVYDKPGTLEAFPDPPTTGQRRLAYRGRIDDSWKDESKVTRRELADAIEALLDGRQPSAEQRPSMGCSIKWKS